MTDSERAARTTVAADDGSPPLFQGTLWKKSPNPLRIRKFQQRYVELALGFLTWSAEKGKTIKGRLDFSKNDCEVSEKVGSTTEFEVRPRGGAWKDGDFTGVDSGRSLIFDSQDSEYERRRWIEVVSLHISYGMKYGTPSPVNEVNPFRSFASGGMGTFAGTVLGSHVHGQASDSDDDDNDEKTPGASSKQEDRASSKSEDAAPSSKSQGLAPTRMEIEEMATSKAEDCTLSKSDDESSSRSNEIETL